MRGRFGRAIAFVAALLAATVVPAASAAQSGPLGVWNIRSKDMTDRATGGVRAVLLRVEEGESGPEAEITTIRNTFMPVEEFRYEDGVMHVVFGSYEYVLEIDGDELSGVLMSPLGRQEVSGFRQYDGLLYVGDEPEEFETTRPGVLGLASGAAPPDGVPDAGEWIRAEIDSVDDLALVVGRRARVPVPFTNAHDFEEELLALAGREVVVVGVWVGERLRLESIEPASRRR